MATNRYKPKGSLAKRVAKCSTVAKDDRPDAKGWVVTVALGSQGVGHLPALSQDSTGAITETTAHALRRDAASALDAFLAAADEVDTFGRLADVPVKTAMVSVLDHMAAELVGAA